MTARPRRALRTTALGLVAITACLAATVLPVRPAGAAGVTTHAWMALEAIDEVTDADLKALLVANAPYVRSGAHFPDSGYALTNQYGEEAHWQRFHDAYADQILTKPCGDLAAPNGPCAKQIAFLMGMIGHGIGDEVWDWLFEPNVADLEEYYTPSSLAGQANEGGAELQMDLVAIADFAQPTDHIVAFPSHSDILAAFAAVGFTQVDGNALNLGQIAMNVVHDVEAGWAPTHIDELHDEMPWMSHNLVRGPGGVAFAATAIAGEWNAMWGRLNGDQPPTSVSITYPADGQRRVPATGWNRSIQPGSARGRGGAKTRVAAVLTYARPYDGSAGTVSSQLPAGAMTLVETDGGEPVALQSGWPRSVPYGPDAGERMIGLQPAADLAPCTWYTASITAELKDANDEPVVPMSWDFRTGADGGDTPGADGGRCPDDPYTADENFARAVLADVVDQEASDDDLEEITYDFDRGTSRRSFVGSLLASDELRRAVVTRSFDHNLDRAPDPSGLAYWSTKLKTISIPEFESRLIGSAEIYRNAGSTNAGYVTLLYQLVHGRDVDPSGLAYWTGKLDRGLRRESLAKQLLTSPESARRTVGQAYVDLLGRTADAGGLAYWSGVLQRGGDPRPLWQQLILSNEYNTRAQAG